MGTPRGAPLRPLELDPQDPPALPDPPQGGGEDPPPAQTNQPLQPARALAGAHGADLGQGDVAAIGLDPEGPGAEGAAVRVSALALEPREADGVPTKPASWGPPLPVGVEIGSRVRTAQLEAERRPPPCRRSGVGSKASWNAGSVQPSGAASLRGSPRGWPRGAPLRVIALEGCHRPGRPGGDRLTVRMRWRPDLRAGERTERQAPCRSRACRRSRPHEQMGAYVAGVEREQDRSLPTAHPASPQEERGEPGAGHQEGPVEGPRQGGDGDG